VTFGNPSDEEMNRNDMWRASCFFIFGFFIGIASVAMTIGKRNTVVAMDPQSIKVQSTNIKFNCPVVDCSSGVKIDAGVALNATAGLGL